MSIQRGVLDGLRRLFMVLAIAFETIGYVTGFHTKLLGSIECFAVLVLVVWFGLVIYSDIIKDKQNEVI